MIPNIKYQRKGTLYSVYSEGKESHTLAQIAVKNGYIFGKVTFLVSFHFLVYSLMGKYLLIMPSTGEVRVRVGCANRAVRRVRTWTCAKRRALQGGFLALWGDFRGAGAVLEWRQKALPPGKTEGVNTSRREAVMGSEAREAWGFGRLQWQWKIRPITA